MICSVPSAPCSCVPGAMCCQRQRKRWKIERGYRLDLAPQAAEGRAVNARQNAPVAPLDFTVAFSYGETAPAAPAPRASSVSSALFDFFADQRQPLRERSDRGRAERFHPAANREHGIVDGVPPLGGNPERPAAARCRTDARPVAASSSKCGCHSATGGSGSASAERRATRRHRALRARPLRRSARWPRDPECPRRRRNPFAANRATAPPARAVLRAEHRRETRTDSR